MPDTGAPWNIPYVEPSDLVRDYPSDSEDLAEAIADGLDAANNAGIGSNVVQTVKVDTFSTASTSFQSVTGLSVTITPSSATSKVLVIGTITTGGGTNGGQGAVQIYRDAVALDPSTGATYNATAVYNPDTSKSNYISVVLLDSPATTSATTYEWRLRTINASWTQYVNRRGTDTANGAVSSIVAIEVAP
jgi:hypothetical protein